jgi:BirA family biotin operon repressor/biotin-[acetyl-CoA-carboxylase] ligase
LSGDKKICGILNELKVKGDKIENIIIGFGLNVNQVNFQNLPNASSLKLINNINYDLDRFVSSIIQSLKKNNYLNSIPYLDFEKLTIKYHKNLYGINENKFFLDYENKKFIGKIISVNKMGIIKIKIADNSIKNYNFQEIQMIY